MLTLKGVVNTRFNISKRLSGGQIVRPARDEKPGIKFVWPILITIFELEFRITKFSDISMFYYSLGQNYLLVYQVIVAFKILMWIIIAILFC